MLRLLFLTGLYLFSYTSLWALAPGTQIPSLSAKNQDGKVISLENFKGRYVLVYFYPKDDTPGCTQEAISFRNNMETFKKMGTVILGVSRQDEKSHQEFRKKHDLPFDLLADTDGSLAQAFSIGNFLPIPGVQLSKRQSVLIGPDGKVARFYEEVDPAKHADEVIRDIRNLQIPK